MLNLINFDEAEIARGVFYGGDAGAKHALLINGEGWMLKYPKTTRELTNPQISYTTSPLSEYIGSMIYESLRIPVHKTMPGIRNNKVVVACKDFTRERDTDILNGEVRLRTVKQLIPFHDMKNSFMTSDLDSYSGTGSETLLDEVLATIAGQDDLKTVSGVSERFWDMFVVDAFIGNNDRNNNNWGILLDQASGELTLAPVYDNGNAFFNKRGTAQMEKRLSDSGAMREDAYLNPLCAYKYSGTNSDGQNSDGQKINPFAYIAKDDNPDCRAALKRFVKTADMRAIGKIISEIPETFDNLAVMPIAQKKFYLELMRIRLEEVFLPAADKFN